MFINNNVSFGVVHFANAYASLGKFGHLRVRSLVWEARAFVLVQLRTALWSSINQISYQCMDLLVFKCWSFGIWLSKTLIINEGRTYAFYRHQSEHFTNLKTMFIEFYDDTSITETKAVI